MRTGFVKRPVLPLALPLLLCGCLEGASLGDLSTGTQPKRLSDLETEGEALGFLSSIRRPLGPVLRDAKLAGGHVVVEGPTGYCIEGRSLKTRAQGGFAVLARCDILSGGAIGPAVTLALLTVTVAPADGTTALPSVADMAQDFADDGVEDMVDAEGVRMLHLETGGNALIPAADPRHWRGAFLLNGYVVGLAAYGPKDSAAVADGGQALLIDMARHMRRASPDAGSLASPGVAVEDTPGATVSPASTLSGAENDPEPAGTAKPAGNTLGSLFQ